MSGDPTALKKKKVMADTIDEKRPRGRHRRRWIKIVKADLGKFAPGLEQSGEIWRKLGPTEWAIEAIDKEEFSVRLG